MDKEDQLKSFLNDKNGLINKITNRLLSQNSDYTREQIYSMVVSDIWEKIDEEKNLSEKSIYLSTLNRVLEEKGLRYRGKDLYSPLVRTEYDILSIESDEDFYHKINKSDFSFATDTMLSVLSQPEIMVIALSYGLSTPAPLSGKHKKFLDNVEDTYYSRKLTHKEIAAIMGLTVNRMLSVKNKAFKKLVKKYRASWKTINGQQKVEA